MTPATESGERSTPAARLATAALRHLPYVPLTEQTRVLYALADFTTGSKERDILIINGYAGTGKTSIIGAFIKALSEAHRNVVMLAPTGRAAKVAGIMAGHQSCTIHKRLFRGNSADPNQNVFFIAANNDRDTIFFIDEASLIGDNPNPGHSLLALIIRHIYSAPGCRAVLIGDEAQLPPVGQETSAAMNPRRLRELGFNPIRFSLDIPLRQQAKSGILYNASIVRQYLFRSSQSGEVSANIPHIQLTTIGFKDIIPISSSQLDDYLLDSYSKAGEEETIIITRSNKRANNFNRAIRNIVLGADTPLQQGDRIIISKNDYFWSKRNKLQSFIANGDIAIVSWVGKSEKMYGRYFTEVELYFPADDITISANLMLRSLVTDGPAIPRNEMERLYNVVLSETGGEISHKISAAMNDPYYNALQAKYAYCITCHKAQGGQWRHVYIDMGAIAPDAIGPDFYRWLYTALTRATECVYLINPGRFADASPI